MQLLRELSRTQGTTYIVVTHDPAVARQTNRVLVMADGRIVREDIIGSPIEEDLKMWLHSGLGRRIVEGDQDTMKLLALEGAQVEAVRALLGRADGQ